MIPELLLQTKLQTPRRRTLAVARSRLITRLNDGLESRLILISAPAGFGKTTLLTEWLSDNRYPSTWLSLDGNDNDLSAFLGYFIAALQKLRPNLGESARDLISSKQYPVESVFTNLINEISSVPEHFIVVMDDYHTIVNTSIHQGLSFLIDNLPSNAHLVFSTRSDPPLNLARLRGRGQLTELRADDLRFNLNEIAEFLNKVMALNLSQEEINLLNIRSEGWIAGLQMAAITLRKKTDIAGFIRAFSSSNRNMADYLFEEVFSHQTPEIQSFLLETSILERLNPELCNAVTERKDSSQILERIEKSDLFISVLDDESQWYRYHTLFKDLLQHTLSNAHIDKMSVLHRRASEWYERESMFTSAITHALKAKDYNRAAGLIEKRAGEILSQGEFATYLSWMDSFPQSIIQMYPDLVLHRLLAETLAMGLTLDDVETKLQELEKSDPQNNLIKGAAMVVRSVALGNQADLSKNTGLCREALSLLPPESTFWRGIAISGLKQYWLLEGGIPSIAAAISLYNDAMENGRKIGNIFFRIVGRRRLAEAYIAGGRLGQAYNHYQEILDEGMNKQGQLIPLASFGLFGLGMLHREWNELDKALEYLKKGITLESGKLGHWQVDGIIELARTRQAMGNMEGASQYLQEARQLLNKFPMYRESHESIITTHEIILALAQGDMKKVNSWVKEFDPEQLVNSFGIEGEIPIYIPRYPARELELLTLVRAYLAQNKPAEALKLLEAIIKASEKLGRAGVMLEAHILSALAYKALGNAGEALSYLKVALQAAEPEGYIRLFLDAGPDMASLLYEAARQGITPAYIHRLIAALPIPEPESKRPDTSKKIEEPLSDRELGVLKLIALGLSNKEIGERLYIETRTVKWHTSNIFGKLGVKNRTQAVARARELGIVKIDSTSLGD